MSAKENELNWNFNSTHRRTTSQPFLLNFLLRKGNTDRKSSNSPTSLSLCLPHLPHCAANSTQPLASSSSALSSRKGEDGIISAFPHDELHACAALFPAVAAALNAVGAARSHWHSRASVGSDVDRHRAASEGRHVSSIGCGYRKEDAAAIISVT